MNVSIAPTKAEAGRRAAEAGAALLREALRARGHAVIILATGASQFDMLDHLVREPEIDWSAVQAFHLDEYIGLSIEHPASFRRYLRERFVERLPQAPQAFHYINAEKNPEAEIDRLNRLLAPLTVDVAFVGIGENGHLAFNDPPADFTVEDPYITVELDERSRQQQLGEGWFESLEVVPRHAVSMSVRQIMKARAIICTVPEGRKAEAVQKAVEGPVTPDVPSSILQEHPDCRLFLDADSAAQLQQTRA